MSNLLLVAHHSDLVLSGRNSSIMDVDISANVQYIMIELNIYN